MSRLTSLFQQLEYDPFELRWQMPIQPSGRNWNLIQHRFLKLGACFSDYCALPGCHFVEYQSERKQVGSGIQFLSPNLFARHVSRRAEGHPSAAEKEIDRLIAF